MVSKKKTSEKKIETPHVVLVGSHCKENVGNSELQKIVPIPVGVECYGDDFIRSHIYTIRGEQVMLDSDLAKIYHAETRVFNQAVKRNEDRFPSNFRFRLSMEEYRSLISQIVTSKEEVVENRGGRQKAPYVFTEQGIAMLSGVLRSEVAVRVSVKLMNAHFIPSIMERI